MFLKKHACSFAPPGVFGRAESRPGDDGAKQTRVGAPRTPRFARSIKAELRLARQHTYAQRPTARGNQLSKSLPPDAFLLLSLRARRAIKLWRGCQRTFGVGARAPAHGLSAAPAGVSGTWTPLAALTGALPAKIGPPEGPLPIPSAAKFHPRAGTACGAASRPYTPTPQTDPKARQNLRPKTLSQPRPERSKTTTTMTCNTKLILCAAVLPAISSLAIGGRRLRKNIKMPDPVPREGIDEVIKTMESGKLFSYNVASKEESQVSLVEKEFADFTGHKFAVGLNSCGSAIFLMLKCAGAQHGDKVLTNGFTFTAVPSAIVHAGCDPVYVETTPGYVVDVADLEKKMDANPDCKYFIVSHMRGKLASMDAIKKLCDAKGVELLEDCAHSLGVLWNGGHSGHHGTMAAFSSQSYKMLNSGRGGFFVTDDDYAAARCMAYAGAYEALADKHFCRPCDAALAKVMDGSIPNFSLRMHEGTAAMLRPQIKTIEARSRAEYNERYYRIAAQLNALPGCSVEDQLPQVTIVGDSVQFNVEADALGDGPRRGRRRLPGQVRRARPAGRALRLGQQREEFQELEVRQGAGVRFTGHGGHHQASLRRPPPATVRGGGLRDHGRDHPGVARRGRRRRARGEGAGGRLRPLNRSFGRRKHHRLLPRLCSRTRSFRSVPPSARPPPPSTRPRGRLSTAARVDGRVV